MNVFGIYVYFEYFGEVEDGFCGFGWVIFDFEIGDWVFEMVKFGLVMDVLGMVMVLYISLWLVVRGINVGL